METLFNAPSLPDFLSYPNVLSPFAIWGAVQGAKNILSKGCSWKVEMVRRLDSGDVWILDHLLIEDFEDQTQIEKCKQLYGTFVGHYWCNNSWVSLIDTNQYLHNI